MLQKDLEAKRVESIRTAAQHRASVRHGRLNTATTQTFAHDGLWRHDSEFRDSATTKEWHEHLIREAAHVQGENEVLQAQIKRLQALSEAHTDTQAKLKESLHQSSLRRRMLISQINTLKLEDPDAAAELWDLIYSPSITPRASRSASFSESFACDPAADNTTGTVTLAGNGPAFEELDAWSGEEEQEQEEEEEEEEVESSEIFGRDFSFQVPRKASEVDDGPFEVPNLKSSADLVSNDELSLHAGAANAPENIILEKYEAPLSELQRITAFLHGGEFSSQDQSLDGLDIEGQHGGVGEDDILAKDLSRYDEPISKLMSVLDTVARPDDTMSSPDPFAAEDTSKFERPLDELIGALGSLKPFIEFHNPQELAAETLEVG